MEFSEIEAVWLACAIDTDGYVGITARNQKTRTKYYHYYLPQMGFSNTDRRLVDHFAKIIDISVPPPWGETEKWKPKYSAITLSSEKIKLILEKILPYLISKQDRAQFVLDYCKFRLSNPGDHSGKTTRVNEDREWYLQYRKLFPLSKRNSNQPNVKLHHVPLK